MIELSWSYKNSINKRVTLLSFLEQTDNYDFVPMGEGVRVNPCPLSGSTKNAFSVTELDDGLEHFFCFNDDRLDGMEDVPETGTVADLISSYCDSFDEILEILRNPMLPSSAKRSVKHEEKPRRYLSQEKLRDVQRFYYWNLWDTPEGKPALDYLTNVRHLTEDVIEQAGLGWSVNRQAVSYPFYSDRLGGTLRHIKFKMRKGYFGHQESYTSQLAENSGGDWLYNAFALGRPVVWLVEGEHDALRLWQSKKIAAVGISGKCSEKTERYREVMSIKGKKVILAFDLDGAGEEYCQQFANLKLTNEVYRAQGVGKDPDEWFLDPVAVSLKRVG